MQYQALLFFHDDEQEAAAVAARDRIAAERGDTVRTRLVDMADTAFWNAEDYHQKYYLRNSALGESVRAQFDDEASFRDSTLATRANAHVGGHLDGETFAAAVRQLGYALEDGRVVRPRAMR